MSSSARARPDQVATHGPSPVVPGRTDDRSWIAKQISDRLITTQLHLLGIERHTLRRSIQRPRVGNRLSLPVPLA